MAKPKKVSDKWGTYSCEICGTQFENWVVLKRRFCSLECKHKNTSKQMLGNKRTLGYKHTSESLNKIKIASTKMWNGDKGKIPFIPSRDFSYIKWRQKVYDRDNGYCKINNGDCCGRLEAHHILPWRDYPELRYDINNGILLCSKHHPRKRDDEMRCVEEFRKLIYNI